MSRFNLQRFLAETGLSLARLASYLQVAQTYLEAAAHGHTSLTRRDQEACRTLWRRLVLSQQMELPFAEPAEAFTREHGRSLARARAKRPLRKADGVAASAAKGAPSPRGRSRGKAKKTRTARTRARQGGRP